MKHSVSRHASQRGISLVEMGIAGVIVAILLVGALMALQKLQLERQMHQARQEIPLTLSAIGRSTATQANTLGINTQMVSLLEAWPATRVTNAGRADVRVAGPFPGSTESVFGTSLMAIPRLRVANQGFNYWISNIPARACLPMLQLLAVQNQVAYLTAGEAAAVTPAASVYAGNTKLMVFSTNGLASLNMALATTACSGEGNKQISAIVTRLP